MNNIEKLKQIIGAFYLYIENSSSIQYITNLSPEEYLFKWKGNLYSIEEYEKNYLIHHLNYISSKELEKDCENYLHDIKCSE